MKRCPMQSRAKPGGAAIDCLEDKCAIWWRGTCGIIALVKQYEELNKKVGELIKKPMK